MPSEYRCICFQCGDKTVRDSLPDAQQFFDVHAGRGHEVEIAQRGHTVRRQ